MSGNPMDDALEGMEAALQRPTASPGIPMVHGTDWYQWRRKHPLWIGKTGEDGSLEDWQELLRCEGGSKLDTAILAIRAGRKGVKVRYADVLEWLEDARSEDPAQDEAKEGAAAKRARIDLLVWCICHNPKCYADAIGGPWIDVGDGVKADPLTPERRTKLEAMAADARKELLTQTGCPDEDKWKPKLYHTVSTTPRLLAWLRGQRLIP